MTRASALLWQSLCDMPLQPLPLLAFIPLCPWAPPRQCMWGSLPPAVPPAVPLLQYPSGIEENEELCFPSLVQMNFPPEDATPQEMQPMNNTIPSCGDSALACSCGDCPAAPGCEPVSGWEKICGVDSF